MVYFSFFWSRRVKKFSFLFIYLFIHLFIYLSVFFSSNPNMVESGDSSRERSSSLFWLDGKQHSQSVVKEEGEEGENKDKRKQNERQEMKSEWEGAAVRRAWQCPFILKYSALPLNLAPDSSFQQKHGVSKKIKRKRERARERESYSKIWLSISRVNTNVLTLS